MPTSVADPGEGPGPAPPPHHLFLDQTEAQRAEKFFFGGGGDCTPPPPSQGMDPALTLKS